MLVDSAKHEDRVVSRRCGICNRKVEYPCYPRTGDNQLKARSETKRMLREHITHHSISELVEYVKRLHQV